MSNHCQLTLWPDDPDQLSLFEATRSAPAPPAASRYRGDLAALALDWLLRFGSRPTTRDDWAQAFRSGFSRVANKKQWERLPDLFSRYGVPHRVHYTDDIPPRQRMQILEAAQAWADEVLGIDLDDDDDSGEAPALAGSTDEDEDEEKMQTPRVTWILTVLEQAREVERFRHAPHSGELGRAVIEAAASRMHPRERCLLSLSEEFELGARGPQWVRECCRSWGVEVAATAGEDLELWVVSRDGARAALGTE